ncbi:MAG TPA: glycosyltransferase [Selenomonadales bacterium]|nr:glycosyltransferase [Selenomonadales bacterium]
MKTSIIILTQNERDRTRTCIENIRKYTEPEQYELIIVDNQSTDGTVDWLKTQDDLKVIYNDRNAGHPQGYNQGLAIAAGDNVLLLRNDVVVTSGWLSNLLHCLYSNDTIGAVSPTTNICGYYQSIAVHYQTLEEMQEYAARVNQPHPEFWEERLKLVGHCTLIKKEVLDKVGQLDEQFTPGGLEDEDYSLRIRLAGYKLILCKDTFVHNSGNTAHQIDNRGKFIAKWGFDPVYSTFIRHEIINLIDKSKDRPFNVLEVGCACGGTLLQIKNIYPKAEIAGIELNEEAALSAKLFAEVIAADIENTMLPFPVEHFDYIIFADVLEHLVNPWQALENMRPYLKPDGQILASIPNVMHFSVIRSLLQGNWRYEDAGILDRTHMRFFTLNEIDFMFKNAGYKLNVCWQTTLNETESDKNFIQTLVAFGGDPQLAYRYRAYQYIVRADKTPAMPAG